jgi:hypothetical protein
VTEPRSCPPGGWTPDLLHQLMLRLLDEADKRYAQRFDGQEKAVSAALMAAEKAVNKAEAANDLRFASVNEFRQVLTDQTATFITRPDRDLLAARIDACSSRLDKIEGRGGGLNAGWGYLIGAVGVAAAIISTVVAVVRH